MDTIRRFNRREQAIMAGAVFEYLHDKFPKQARGAKSKMSKEITEDIIHNFEFNSGLDILRDMQIPQAALRDGIKLPKTWKLKNSKS